MKAIHLFLVAGGLVLAACTTPPARNFERLVLERELGVLGGDVAAMAWSPDGQLLAVGGMAGDVVIVDPIGVAPDRVLWRDPAAGTAMHLCWSADGSRVAAAWRATGLVVFDVARREALAMRAELRGPIAHRDGEAEFVCFTADGHPILVEDTTLQDRRRLVLPTGGSGSLLALSPDGHRLAVSVTHTCRLFEFELATDAPLRELGDGEGAVLGLAWPAGAATPWWLDQGAGVLHAFDAPRRCIGRALQVQGQRVAVLGVDGWALLRGDGSSTSLGDEHGHLALSPDGAGWARAARGRIDIGCDGAVVRSLPSPVAFEHVPTGQLLDGGRIACVDALGPRAFALTSGATVATTGMPGDGELVRNDVGDELVWRQGDQVSWWCLGEAGSPVAGKQLAHRFFQLPELSGPPRLYGRWLVRSTEAIDVLGELPSPRLPPSLGGSLLPVQGGDVKWISAIGGEVTARRADGEALRRLGEEGLGESSHGMGVVDLAASPDGRQVAVALYDHPTQVFDVASGRRLGESGNFKSVRFLDPDTLIGSSYSKAERRFEISAWTTTGRQLASWPCDGYGILLDVAPASRRALVAERGRVFVLSWR